MRVQTVLASLVCGTLLAVGVVAQTGTDEEKVREQLSRALNPGEVKA